MSSIHIIALLVTLTTECAGFAFYSAWIGKSGTWIRRGTLIVAAVNFVTHTLFWFSYPLGIFDLHFELLCFEVLIVGVEAYFYSRLIAGQSLARLSVVSLVLNLLSFFGGELVWFTYLQPGA